MYTSGVENSKSLGSRTAWLRLSMKILAVRCIWPSRPLGIYKSICQVGRQPTSRLFPFSSLSVFSQVSPRQPVVPAQVVLVKERPGDAQPHRQHRQQHRPQPRRNAARGWGSSRRRCTARCGRTSCLAYRCQGRKEHLVEPAGHHSATAEPTSISRSRGRSHVGRGRHSGHQDGAHNSAPSTTAAISRWPSGASSTPEPPRPERPAFPAAPRRLLHRFALGLRIQLNPRPLRPPPRRGPTPHPERTAAAGSMEMALGSTSKMLNWDPARQLRRTVLRPAGGAPCAEPQVRGETRSGWRGSAERAPTTSIIRGRRQHPVPAAPAPATPQCLPQRGQSRACARIAVPASTGRSGSQRISTPGSRGRLSVASPLGVRWGATCRPLIALRGSATAARARVAASHAGLRGRRRTASRGDVSRAAPCGGLGGAPRPAPPRPASRCSWAHCIARCHTRRRLRGTAAGAGAASVCGAQSRRSRPCGLMRGHTPVDFLFPRR